MGAHLHSNYLPAAHVFRLVVEPVETRSFLANAHARKKKRISATPIAIGTANNLRAVP
ncbi:MAG: hypothetical protein ACR2GN_09270 [Bacteroidia bacterium]